MTSLTASSIQWGVVPHVALERVRCRALSCLRSKLRMVVASVARLFEEVICSGCLCASDLGFVPVFRLDTQRVWRVVVEWLLRLLITPPSAGWYWLAIWLQCTAHRRVAFR